MELSGCKAMKNSHSRLQTLLPTLPSTMEGRLYLGKLPLGGSEISLRREIGVERATSIPLTTLIHHTVSPPIDRKSTFGNLESKEYDNGCNGDTARESGG